MVLSTEWSQVEVIDLHNDGNGLGFILAGGKSTGVIIKGLIPGGVAERDGRLQTGDHVLQIGEVNLRAFSSEQVATVLRQTGSQVRIVVARPVEPTSPDYQALASHAPIIPTKLLSDPEAFERQVIHSAGYTDAFIAASINEADSVPIDVIAAVNAINVGRNSLTLISPTTFQLPLPIIDTYHELPETETYDVELNKNVYGLGITVAGYVCEEEDLSGIFVKSIIEGSAAEKSGKIQINDRIVAVDLRSLSGVTNHQAVEILRNTGISVNLTLERFLRGRKYEHLQVALTESKAEQRPQQLSLPPSPSVTTLSWIPAKSDADNNSITTECGDCIIELELASHTTIDSNVFAIENGEKDDDTSSSSKDCTPTPTPSIDSLTNGWVRQLPDSKIIVSELSKLSGLGISLEGTVEVEGGVEVRPHHFIRSILDNGPVAKDGSFRPGDELLQVNEYKLQGLRHTEVVKILKELPSHVKLVCARGSSAPTVINTSQNPEAFEARSILAGGLQSLQGVLTKAQSESSLYTSSTATLTDQQRSKSVEQVSGLALWSSDITFVELEKNERGFGFSILDYQDPIDSDGTVIVVRGLIPGGSAELSNLIFPGDRLVYVNQENLNGLNLDQAVNILKCMPLGIVKLGLCRPLSSSDNNVTSPETPTT